MQIQCPPPPPRPSLQSRWRADSQQMQIDASSLTPCQTGQAPPHARRVVVVGGPLHRRQQPVLPQRMVAASPLRVRRPRRLGIVSALAAICRCACRPARAAFAFGSRFRVLTFFPPYSVFCDETIESVPECPSMKSTIAPAVLAPVASLAYYDSPHRQAYLIIINLMDLLSTSSSIDEVRTC